MTPFVLAMLNSVASGLALGIGIYLFTVFWHRRQAVGIVGALLFSVSCGYDVIAPLIGVFVPLYAVAKNFGMMLMIVREIRHRHRRRSMIYKGG